MKILYCMVANLVGIIFLFEVLHLFYPDNIKLVVKNKCRGFHWSPSTSCFCHSVMLIGKAFHFKLTWKQMFTLILARRRKKVIKVNTKLHMLRRCKYWKKKPKSKAPWDIQVCFFVILKVERIDFNSLVLILYIYLLEKRKLMCLFHPHCFGCVHFTHFDYIYLSILS